MILRVSTFPNQHSQTQNVFLEISGLKNHTFWPQSVIIAENYFIITVNMWSRLAPLFGFVMKIWFYQ